ncbi:MAG TPA: LON peptidase substrate-binding domain-containing protein [Planctomycetota bacterium]|nr:LON peptidase substrate-binding domain-containing protein [Planctomycetota bacterium]
MTQPIPETLRVPLFPLPGVVLFPGTVLPLRIFEPRYLALLQDVLSGEKLIGMPQLKPASFVAEQSSATPPVFQTLGVGRVVAQEQAPDGTWNIALLGQWRCRIVSEIPHRPYRIAQLQILKDTMPTNVVAEEQLRRGMHALKRTAIELAQRTLDPEAAGQLKERLEDHVAPGIAADVLGCAFIHDPALRQALLENCDVGVRVLTVQKLLEQKLEQTRAKLPTRTLDKDVICLN